MYTGIVQEVGRVLSVAQHDYGKQFAIQCTKGFLTDIVIGASVAVNGTCFTVVNHGVEHGVNNENTHYFVVDAVQVTLDITNINTLTVDSLVNLERSAKIGDENGGHQIAGHIIGTAKIVEIQEHPHGLLRIEIPKDIIKYIFEKGFIAVNGISLTVAKVDAEAGAEGNADKSIVRINLIPETMRATNLLTYGEGDYLNLEIDQITKSIVDTMHHVLAQRG